MIPSQSDAYKYALCMELNQTTFSCAIINTETNQTSFYKESEFDVYNSETVSQLLNETYFDLEYKSITISVATERSTLVPMSIFNSSDTKNLFKLNHLAPIDNLDYSRMAEHGLVSIYEMPLWIKSLFVKKFIKIKILHHSTVLLKGIFKQAVYPLKAHILKNEQGFYLVITEKGKLVYFNWFKVSEITDLIYYYLFVLEQKELDQKKVPLWVYGLESRDEEIDKMNELLLSKVQLHDSSELQNKFIITNQLLCV